MTRVTSGAAECGNAACSDPRGRKPNGLSYPPTIQRDVLLRRAIRQCSRGRPARNKRAAADSSPGSGITGTLGTRR